MVLSIIIPHYNSSQMVLHKLLPSIPDNDNIEIIIIDDNSDENHYYNLVSGLNYIKNSKVILKKNSSFKKGAGAARNYGLNLVSGKWVLFADSDDYFVDNFFDRIEPYFNSNFDMIFFPPTSQYINTDIIANRHLTYKKLVEDYFLEKNKKTELRLKYKYYVPWSKMYRYDFIKENNIFFDETLVSNDVMFSIKCGYWVQNFKVTKDIIYCVSKSNNSLTALKSERMFDIRLQVSINMYLYLKEKLEKKDYKKLGLSGIGNIYKAREHGIVKCLTTFFKLKSNKINIFSFNNFTILKKKSSNDYTF